jgi:hypothetical protein
MFKKVKSISEIFEEVKHFDLVITNDAPLATALNKLIETPRLGLLAMTPKQIASKFAQLYSGKIYDKYEIILTISKLTGKPVRLIHSSVEKIYEVWMYNAKLEFTEQFLNEEEKMLMKYLYEFDTIESAMENFNEEFYGEKSIAVAGQELFSLLDLEVLPKRGLPAAKIELFTGEEFKTDKTYIFNSSEQLINNILSLVNNENADDTAIVLDPKSGYLEILKARFKDSEIKIEIKNYLSDETSIRNFISFAELSFRINELKVKEIITLAAEFGINIDSYYNQYDFSSYIKFTSKDKALEKFHRLSLNITKMKYSELLNELKQNYNFNYLPEFAELLELIGIYNETINENNILDLKYILREFDTELNTEKSGVLFVNALNSAFIDRQNVFYVGMDNSWMKLYSDADYLDRKEEEGKNLERFQILLQQGRQRFYFVRNIVDFKEVIPCYYFQMLFEKGKVKFTDDLFNPVNINNEKTEYEYKQREKKLPESEPEIIDYFSPTNLNKYFRCPKMYSFSKLLPEEDIAVFKKGKLLHSFAELYFNHPEFVKSNFKKILDDMTDEMLLTFKESNAGIIKTEFEIGMESIVNFIDSEGFKKVELDIPDKSKDNELMKKFGLLKIYFNTENWLEDRSSTKIAGKLDLQSENTIVDYKSSKISKSESEITLQANLDYIKKYEKDNFDFQAIAYITALRGKFREINFIYNFILKNYKNQINPELKEEKNLTRIRYLPLTFREYISSQEVFEKIKGIDKPGRLMDALGFDGYRYVLDNLNISDEDYFVIDKISEEVIEVFLTVLEENGLSYSNFGCRSQDSLLKNFIMPVGKVIYDIRTGKSGTGMIFKEDADKFTELVKEKLTELNSNLNSTFPFDPVFSSRDICKNCDYLNLCTGNKLWH